MASLICGLRDPVLLEITMENGQSQLFMDRLVTHFPQSSRHFQRFRVPPLKAQDILLNEAWQSRYINPAGHGVFKLITLA